MEDVAGARIHLNEAALDLGAAGEGGDALVDAALVEGGGTPQERGRWRAQRSTPQDGAGQGIQG